MELAKKLKIFYNPDDLENDKMEYKIVKVDHLPDPTMEELVIEGCKGIYGLFIQTLFKL